MNLSEQEAVAFLGSLFPGGLKDPAVIEELCPEGWVSCSDYMRFYMGTWWLARRTDLSPVYRLIFARLKSLGADWTYSFPRLHVIDFGSREEDPGTDYDPSAALAREAERQARANELCRMRRKIDRDTLAAMREARRNEPPATVRAYQQVFRSFPVGWPPDPYPE